MIVSLLKDSTRTKVIDPGKTLLIWISLYLNYLFLFCLLLVGKVYVKILEILDQIKSQFHSNNEEKSDKNKNESENEEKPVQLFSLLGAVERTSCEYTSVIQQYIFLCSHWSKLIMWCDSVTLLRTAIIAWHISLRKILLLDNKDGLCCGFALGNCNSKLHIICPQNFV